MMVATSPDPVPLLLTVEKAVAFSGISRRTLYRLMADGRIVSRKLGKSRLIESDSIVRMVQQLPKG
jgi:excisionase family DNA binding protein